jgi:hypothetical protein
VNPLRHAGLLDEVLVVDAGSERPPLCSLDDPDIERIAGVAGS